ncbi:hypothetical protein MAR_033965 [Mya arenaria]|uniref:Uncharacterized protein n=1 Tax=Mya arenaria TaxID=6604 RepID=A0ABY7GAJ5_MYAAR|nr:hypothetical protein MAR_033965 [Mya arenaria]
MDICFMSKFVSCQNKTKNSVFAKLYDVEINVVEIPGVHLTNECTYFDLAIPDIFYITRIADDTLLSLQKDDLQVLYLHTVLNVYITRIRQENEMVIMGKHFEIKKVNGLLSLKSTENDTFTANMFVDINEVSDQKEVFQGYKVA